MKKRALVIAMLIGIIGGSALYLNRSYAHMYDGISEANLQSPDKQRTYQFGTVGEKPFVYVALGDSLTSGVGATTYEQSYPYRVAQQLAKEKTNVVLHTQAIPGARAADLRGVSLEAVIATQPDMVTILFGTNDVHGNISKDVFKDAYSTILSRLSSETDAQLYVIAIPYLGAPELIIQPYRLYFDLRTRAFNATLKQLATEYAAVYIDLYQETAQTEQDVEDYYAADLFHPSAIGYALWADIVYASRNQ